MQIRSGISRRMAVAASAIVGLALAGTTAGNLAWAQAPYPNKPIKLIVPFPPGGGTDLLARTVAQKLSDTLKWTVIIDNRPGAGGNIGVDATAKAAPDGYTLVMGQTSNLAVNPTLYPKLPYDPLKDLVPVVLVASSPIAIVVTPQSRYKSFADIVAAAKATPDALTLGFSGNGTVAHLSGEQVKKAAGIRMQNVPYKGAAQAMTDVMSGQVDIYMSSVPTLLGHVNNGKLRAIAVTSATRSSELPQTPTLAESGYPGFDASTWFGILAPAGTPAAIVKTLNTEINKVLKQPDVAAKLKSEGGDVLGGSAEQFGALLKTDIVRWGQIVRDSGARID
ncbi:tripartite tricarboxylate transporter substrate binding protein [Xylophilus sp. GW821-FHT01B05]